MNDTNQKPSFLEETFDRKTCMEITRCVAWTAAFTLTFYGIRKLFS